jgi:hypothetical protein
LEAKVRVYEVFAKVLIAHHGDVVTRDLDHE